MRSFVASPLVKALATNRILAAWLVAMLWGVSMVFAFVPGIVVASLMTLFHPVLRILWLKAYRDHKLASGQPVKQARTTCCGCA